MIALLCLLILLTLVFAHQTRRHERLLASIPVRIHVNGSRGKSSVTRLIAAGLRAGGIRTAAKTTGTMPSFINPDGSEDPIMRGGNANIIEQVGIVRRAARLKVEALVVECMGIKPELQGLLEDRMIRSTHSLITNVRADHLEEMGPRMIDVAQSLARTIPRGGAFYTAEPDYQELLAHVAAERGSTVHLVQATEADEAVLGRFSYFEHAENVALAVAVCASLGVDRAVALDGMVKATPDPGAMRIYHVSEPGADIHFVNGFAVNDPDSYLLAWERLDQALPVPRKVLGLVVCRRDRIERSQQLGRLLASGLPVDVCLATGSETAPFRRALRRRKGEGPVLLDMEGAGADEIFAAVREHCGEVPLVAFGIGNIVGLGTEIVEEFSSHATQPAHPTEDGGVSSGWNGAREA